LLHCISCYPTKNTDANLINIHKLKEKFNLEVGYSDHTEGIDVAANSVFFGAVVIEKHFMPKITRLAGDYKLSIDEKNLKKLVLKIRRNFQSIGNERIGQYNCEKYYKKTLRRSIYFSKNIKMNKKISMSDFNFLRPFSKIGLQIEEYEKFIGSKLKTNVKKNQLVKKIHFQK